MANFGEERLFKEFDTAKTALSQERKYSTNIGDKNK